MGKNLNDVEVAKADLLDRLGFAWSWLTMAVRQGKFVDWYLFYVPAAIFAIWALGFLLVGCVQPSPIRFTPEGVVIDDNLLVTGEIIGEGDAHFEGGVTIDESATVGEDLGVGNDVEVGDDANIIDDLNAGGEINEQVPLPLPDDDPPPDVSDDEPPVDDEPPSPPPPVIPTVDLLVNGGNVGEWQATDGSFVVLSWVGTSVTSCAASGAWQGTRSSAGSEIAGPLTGPATLTFTLLCVGAGGQAVDTVTVRVSPPIVIDPPDPPVGPLSAEIVSVGRNIKANVPPVGLSVGDTVNYLIEVSVVDGVGGQLKLVYLLYDSTRGEQLFTSPIDVGTVTVTLPDRVLLIKTDERPCGAGGSACPADVFQIWDTTGPIGEQFVSSVVVVDHN